MSLPKLMFPNYEVVIPSSGKTVMFRPFLVKEEKILLMAADSNDPTEIVNTVKQILTNCIIDDVNLDKLPFFDVDYLFNMIRAKSISERIEIELRCNVENAEGQTCGNIFDSEIDLTKAKIVKDDNIVQKISLGNNVIIKMKYPSYSDIRTLNENQDAIDIKIDLIVKCVEYIAEGDNLKSPNKDFTLEELRSFIENLPVDSFKKLEEFVDNFPYFVIEHEAKCTRCGFIHKNMYRDLENFFQ